MKHNFLILILMLFGFTSANAQENPKEQIIALKTAYITEHLQLTPEEAEKFWPIYNKYDQENHNFRMENRNMYCNLNDKSTNKEEAQEILKDYIDLEEARCALRKNMILELANVLPPKKIINLKRVEDDFHRKLLKEYRTRKAEKKE